MGSRPRGSDTATQVSTPAGDPNVLLLDGNGKLLRQERAGQRWINQVALGTDGVVRVVCTMPAGRAGDMPAVFRLGTDNVTAEAIAWRRGQYADGYFHYGDHSNHVTRGGRPGRNDNIVVGDFGTARSQRTANRTKSADVWYFVGKLGEQSPLAAVRDSQSTKPSVKLRTVDARYRLIREFAKETVGVFVEKSKERMAEEAKTKGSRPTAPDTEAGGDTPGVGLMDAILSFARQQEAAVNLSHDISDFRVTSGLVDEKTSPGIFGSSIRKTSKPRLVKLTFVIFQS